MQSAALLRYLSTSDAQEGCKWKKAISRLFFCLFQIFSSPQEQHANIDADGVGVQIAGEEREG